MIQVQCDGCQKRYSVPDNFAGKKVRCKQCSAAISIPAAAALEELAPEAEPSASADAAAPAAKKAVFGKAPAKQNPFGPKAAAGAPKKAAFGGKPLGAGKPLVPRKPVAKPEGSKLASKYASKAEQAEGSSEGSADAADAEAGGSKKKLLLIVGGCVAAACVLTLGYLFWFAPANAPAKTSTPKTPVAADKDDKDAEKKKGAEEKVTDENAADANKAADDTAAAVEPLSLIPADVNLLASIAFGRVANIPAIREQIEARLSSSQEMSELFQDAGFDPLGQLESIWVAVSGNPLPSESGPKEPQFVALLKGTFDQEKVLDALKKRSIILENGKKIGKLDVRELKEGSEHRGYMTFVSNDVVMFGTDEVFNKALKLVEGGNSVRTNKVLKDITKDFSATSAAWVAVDLPKELRDLLAAQAKDFENTPTPIPKVEGGLISLDPSEDGEGIKIAVSGRFPDDKERQKAQGTIAGLKLMVGGKAPPPIKALFDALKIQPEGKTLQLALDLSKEKIDGVKQMIPAMMGVPPDAADAASGDAPEEKPGTEPAMEKPAGEKPADAGSGDEKPAAEEPADGKPADDEKGADEKKVEEPPGGDAPDDKDTPKEPEPKPEPKKKK